MCVAETEAVGTVEGGGPAPGDQPQSGGQETGHG